MDKKFDLPLTTLQPAGRSRALRRAAAALALTAAGAISVTAMAENRRADAPAGASDAQGRAERWDRHGHHRPPGGPGGFGMIAFGLPPGPHADRVLTKIGASDAQKKQIHEITRAAGDDLRRQREEGRALRDEGLALFTQPQVDEKAVEAWRQRTLAQHDLASRRMLQATVDVSRVLTPEQRGKLAELIKERQARFEERLKRKGPPPEHDAKQS